jgi:hypothetical protein
MADFQENEWEKRDGIACVEPGTDATHAMFQRVCQRTKQR